MVYTLLLLSNYMEFINERILLPTPSYTYSSATQDEPASSLAEPAAVCSRAAYDGTALRTMTALGGFMSSDGLARKGSSFLLMDICFGVCRLKCLRSTVACGMLACLSVRKRG